MTQIANQRALSARDLIVRSPELFRGLPKKLRGLYRVAQQRKNPVNNLASCFELAASKFPDNIAVMFEGQSLSYSDFNRKANQIAHYLEGTGTVKGDTIVVMMENRVELLLCVVALAKLGAIAALINTSQRGNVLEHSIRLVSPKRIIVGEELFDACMAVESALPDGDQSVLWVADKATNDTPKNAYDLMAVAGNQSEQNLPHSEHIRANDPLCYFYTSGTTGLPKAAILTNGRYMKAYGGIGEACIQLRSDDRVYVPLPFYHATAMVVAWSSIVSSGATLVLVRKFSASKYWHDVVSQGVTALCYIGELCRYLVAQAPSDIERENKVRVMFGNGLRPEIWREFKQRFDIDRVHEFYGSSEGNVGFMNVLNLDNTVGFSPVPYAIVQYDLDAEEARRFSNGYMRKVSRGEAGLLLGEINEKSPFDGYTEPEKTEKTILRNVFKQGDAWFNTGDMMRDLGFRHAQFVDRLGDTFRWKGENVSTTEVENVLGQYSGVIDAIVYGVEIPKTNGRAGMAALRFESGQSFDGRALYEYLQAHVPDYAIPHFIRLVDEVESTGTHKYKKAPLKKDAYDPQACGSKVFVRLPKQSNFEELTQSLYLDIMSSKHSF
ncbi:hypothetical protein A3715_14550 [Oleiphilus sp. HI0009]|uniref:long-chain-acyl-CoA synthetase n=2 Tax=Oleiphilus TaxID=141450 RepID=UPI0007C40A31|nr:MULTISPECIES: long-chain-acyl-CoA synthetase [unclassified Oleiphilus]KZX75362.1 hypothetical protein A3715_14550 [Oleiphilus sp. HI0009]KZY65373.1 hypothetical protein A3738_01370 [Oleiphilus sp. HI0066]KZY68406.1 hypothetical protein A3739_01135 [Oleiphilus sp. HI0067]